MSDMLRQAVLKGVPELLEEMGVPPTALLHKYGLSRKALEEPDKLFPYRTWVQLLNEAAALTQCPHFGLLVSRAHSMATLGMLGLAMQQAPNAESAQRIFERYFYLHTDAASINVEVSGELTVGTFSIDLADVSSLKQVVDLSLGHGVNIYKFLYGEQTYPVSAHFTHEKPLDIKPYQRLFNCPLVFNADANALCYPASMLSMPIKQRSDELHIVLSNHLQVLENKHPNDIGSQVEHCIRQLLPTGNTGVELVAVSMNMSKRSLQGKLRDANTSYRKLLDGVRADIASAYLADSNVSMTRLADILAYSELSAFSRAFKRWFGEAPKDWQTRNSTTQR